LREKNELLAKVPLQCIVRMVKLHQIGMQAGRVLPQTRWVDPRRKPVKLRNCARIVEVVVCGGPTGPSGAAKPASADRVLEKRRKRGVAAAVRSLLDLPVLAASTRASSSRRLQRVEPRR